MMISYHDLREISPQKARELIWKSTGGAEKKAGPFLWGWISIVGDGM